MNSSTSADTAPTRDALLAGKVTLWQPAQGYRAAIDPVLLAASVEPKAGARALDLGCGVGAIALCLLARCPDMSVLGLELNPELVALARRNAIENGIADRLEIHQGNVAAPPVEIKESGFDLVVTNPPFLEAGTASASADQGRRMANIEGEADLQTWIDAAARALKPKGGLAMIHRADRIDDIIVALRRDFGEIVLHPLWPKPGRTAKRVIIRARKGVSSPARVEAGTVLHRDDGGYSDAAAAVLAGGCLGSRNSL